MTFYLTKYFSSNVLPFIFLLSALLFLVLAILFGKLRERHSLSKEKISYDFLSFQKFLDGYYVTNIWYTLCIALLYFTLLSGIFWFIRLSFIGYEYYIHGIDKDDMRNNNMLGIIFIYFSFLVFIFMYKTLLHVIFFKEIVKLYFYLCKYYWFLVFEEYFVLRNLLEYIYQLGAVFEYLIEKNVEDQEDYFRSFAMMSNNEDWHRITLWRHYIQQKKLLLLVITLIHFLFLHNQSILHKLYVLPKFIFLIVCIAELFAGKLYYIYYLLPVILLWHFLGECFTFLKDRKPIDDNTIIDYFYRNTISYDQVRLYLVSEMDIYKANIYETKQIKALYYMYTTPSFKNYVMINKFIVSGDKRNIIISDEIRSKTLQQEILVVLLFVIYHYAKTWSLLLYIILGILFYLSINAYKYDKIKGYITQKKYYIRTFWVVFGIELLLIYILILQAKFIFMNNDILWDVFITICHPYTVEDKLEYFWRYYDYITNSLFPSKEYETIKNARVILCPENYIYNDTTLEEAKKLVYMFYQIAEVREEMEFLLVRELLMELHR